MQKFTVKKLAALLVVPTLACALMSSAVASDGVAPLSLDAPSRIEEPVNQDLYMPMQTKPQDLTLLTEGPVTEILKSNLIRVGETAYFSLDNIRVPVLYDIEAMDYLKKNVLGKKIKAYASTKTALGRKDRYGNRIAHIVLADTDTWLQNEMVSKGLAWADSTPTNRDLVVPLLYNENTARMAGMGFWSKPNMAVRNDTTIAEENNSFQIYEGTVARVTGKKTTIFLNFGSNNEEDFTIRVDRLSVPAFNQFAAFVKAPFQFLYYVNKRVRVRGWVTQQNGPMIEVTHPEQIEVLREDGTQIGVLPAAP